MTFHLVTASDSNLRSNLKKYTWEMVCEFLREKKKRFSIC